MTDRLYLPQYVYRTFNTTFGSKCSHEKLSETCSLFCSRLQGAGRPSDNPCRCCCVRRAISLLISLFNIILTTNFAKKKLIVGLLFFIGCPIFIFSCITLSVLNYLVFFLSLLCCCLCCNKKKKKRKKHHKTQQCCCYYYYYYVDVSLFTTTSEPGCRNTVPTSKSKFWQTSYYDKISFIHF